MTNEQLKAQIYEMVELGPDGTWELLEERLDVLWNTAYSDGHTDGYDEGFDQGYDEGSCDATQEM